MMDSAIIRTNGAKDFISFYTNVCAIQNLCPIASIKACAKEGVLNCHLHTINRQDLHAILTALRINTVLHTVVFYNKWQEKAYHYYKGVLPIARIPKRSAISKHSDPYIITDIARAIYQLLTVSIKIVSLVIEGINLSKTDFKLLSKSIRENTSLKHLSLKGTFIGDSNLCVLCKVLKGNTILEWIDLTACSLTDTAITHILAVLHHQSVNRQCSIWKESLRAQRPRYSSFPGLRRVTLNINPGISDEGVCLLAEELRDDLWIKCVDLQSCGLTSVSGKAFLDILQSNNTLMVVDLRDNKQIDEDILDSITEMLLANVSSRHPPNEDTYRWLDVETKRIKQEFRTAGIPFMNRHSNRHKASSVTMKPPSTVISMRSRRMSLPKKVPGLPWRTASRSNRRQKHFVEVKKLSSSSSQISKNAYDNNDIITQSNLNSVKPCNDNVHCDTETNSDREQPMVTLTIEEFKVIQEDVRYCQEKLKGEICQREMMQERLLQVESENESLKKQLKTFEKQNREASTSNLTDCTMKNKMDEPTLEAIENTFKQFHLFLDLLNENGYGYLTRLLDSR